jgi:putative transposase
MALPPRSGTGELTEKERSLALSRFHTIRPFLEDGVPLVRIAQENHLGVRTVYRWAENYRERGLAGLCRKARADKRKRQMSPTLQQFIEGLALQKPRPTAAAVHRQAALVAPRLGEPVPCYRTVHLMIQGMDPALMTLAHDGTKSYSDRFDLVHRREAEAPNAIWQADHSELDVLVKDGEGKPRKPWLTIVIDDYSRALAGYLLFFGAPSTIQTALALRQAIWRKSQPGWHICGIPQVLYTDHGSDFTSRHLEQVAVDLKIRLIFSTAGKPRGRGKIERFFKSLSQVFLSRLPGYWPGRAPGGSAVLTLPELDKELERYLIGEYLVTPHSTTRQAPQARWDAGGFLPQMPDSLERLDLLLLTVPKGRRIHQDGIRFLGMRYIDPTLAAYVGENVVLRYDPRDMAEIRVFYHDRFLCRAVCQELAGETVALREIIKARNGRRRQLRQTLQDRRRLVDSLLEAKRWAPAKQESSSPPSEPTPPPVKLKRYFCDE